MSREYNYQRLFDGILREELLSSPPEQITTIVSDSRRCVDGCIFVAIAGEHTNGLNFVEQAVERGASVVVSGQPIDPSIAVCNVVVPETSTVLGILASRYFNSPSQALKLIGVTGTNGKTTVATLLYHAVRALGKKAGLISTIENRIEEEVEPTRYTTPDAFTCNELLARMVDAGCEYAFMEVSSHALAQHRVTGLTFAGGIFTNLTRDHLDYHSSFANYLAAKQSFFTGLPRDAFSLVNVDDRNGQVMVQNSESLRYTYSCRDVADFTARVQGEELGSMQLRIDGHELSVLLLGRFNAYNLLAVYGALRLLSFDSLDSLRVISGLRPVPGRFDYQVGSRGEVVVVDYAHTPDALKNVLEVIRTLRKADGRIITIFGCGGERDHGKRPEMGAVASEHSHWVILTNDNPRGEQPETIMEEIRSGIPKERLPNVLIEPDRRAAIRKGILLARTHDYVLVAGKGHENYQECNGERIHFDDREEVFNVLQELAQEEKLEC